jgi:hypothetical protein
MKSDDNEHYQATLAMHTGSFFFTRPSIGAWVSYGLGTVNQNLPSFVVIAPHTAVRRDAGLGNDFSPGLSPGLAVVPGKEPSPNLAAAGWPKPAGKELELSRGARTAHLATRGKTESELAARIRSFETAFPHAGEAPEAFDLARKSTRRSNLYGLKRGDTERLRLAVPDRPPPGRAGRAVHRTDRHRRANNWDSHADMEAARTAGQKIDLPIAGLLSDLKHAAACSTSTLVVWTTEFGRTPGQDGARRPRPPRRVLLVVARRRRREGRAHLRRDRRIGGTVAENLSTSTTSTPRSCTCWARPRAGSPTATPAATTA